MAISVCEVSLTQSALALPEANTDPQAGATVVFWGAVRATEDSREITGIDYEAHPTMAEHQLRAVAEAAAAKFDLREVTIQHRIGFVPVAQPSVVVRVTSRHREAAFSGAESIMDELKKVVPIWKHAVFKEGTVALSQTASQTSSAPA